MTAKEEALELVENYYLFEVHINDFSYEDAKACALIAVDRIIKQLDKLIFQYFLEVDKSIYEHLEEVKQEINKF